MSDTHSPFNKMSSYIDKIIIPLVNFEYYHKPSNEKHVDPIHIERKKSFHTLKNWLINNKSKGGSYLITGYRGAGKSSFVGRVLNEIAFEKEENISNKSSDIFLSICLIGLSIVSIIAIIFLAFLCPVSDICAVRFYILIQSLILAGVIWKRISLRKKQNINDFNFLPIKINLSHEILHEKDILTLITGELKDKYIEYTSSWEKYPFLKCSRLILNILIASFLFLIYLRITQTKLEIDHKSVLYNINQVLVNLRYPANSPYNWGKFSFDIIVFLLFLLCSKVIRIKMGSFIHNHFNIPLTPTLIIQQKLEDLVERIDASVSIGATNPPFSSRYIQFNFGGKKNKVYATATEREIEQELIRILNLIENNRLYKYRVVIVLDELDKTDPASEDTEDLLPETLPEYEKSTTITSGGTTTRKRKTNVLSIIANMKFFLSSADAYFIFIAGRELYEGFLADISDRDFTITSIFNGVINMDSFLITSRSLNNIAALTEQYICQHLLPTYEECKKELGRLFQNMEFEEENKLLKNAEQYYTFKVYFLYYEKKLKENYKDEKIKTERLKQLDITVHFLTKFSLYLSYISNGSPKKISSFFEKFVRSHAYLGETDALSKSKPLDESNYYLAFSFYSQQRINFIYYLTYPVLQAIINRSNVYGDKLLVSATFIVSHIFKLYNSGFSWRNLEQTPELLETNKTPELREYMISIIDFLKRTHISNISCGLYNYKFPLKIAEEIAYHSKLSDENSALFNFSLDETLQVKRYYFRLLKFYEQQNINSNSENLYVLANIHHILGDTYMNEENYSKANFEYHQSASILKGFIPTIRKQDRLLYYYYLVHTQLKQGLANEKRHTDTSAYAIYVQLVDMLKEIKFSFINTGENRSLILEKSSFWNEKHPLFSEMRMIYQPLLARLYCLEKTGPEGFRIRDIQSTISDFQILASGSCHTDSILQADFYRKLGDITYYKNMGKPEDAKKIINRAHSECKHWSNINSTNDTNTHYSPCIACQAYKESLIILLEKVYSDKHERTSFAFWLFKKITISTSRQQLLESNEELLTQIASGLELRGTTLFSCTHKKDQLSIDFLNKFLEFIESHRQTDPLNFHSNPNSESKKKINFDWIMDTERQDKGHLEKVILYYWCAATCFNYAGNLSAAVRCYRQILIVINSYIYTNPGKGGELNLKLIEEQLINRALISLYSHYENSNILEIQELKWKYSKQMFETIPLNKLSNIPDIEEFLYPFYILKLLIGGVKKDPEDGKEIGGIKKLFHSIFMGKYKTPTGLSITVQNLMLKAQINKALLVELLGGGSLINFDSSDLPKVFYEQWFNLCLADELNENIKNVYDFLEIDPVENDIYKLVEFIIIDTLFCLTQVLEMVIPLKSTTLFTNYFIAETYEQLLHINYLAEFLYFFYSCFEKQEKDKKDCLKEINERITKFINSTIVEGKKDEKYDLEDVFANNQKLKAAKKKDNSVQNFEFLKLGDKSRSELFYKELSQKIKRSNINYTVNVYLAENAIRYYVKAKELHTEGKSYKDTIRNLYFLDDDLYNDTCQFLYARERYFLNYGLIDERLNILKKRYPHSPLYEMGSYL